MKGMKTGGRVPGSLNKVTADIRALAAVHSEDALKVLAQIMMTGEAETARIAAAKELLDRAHGRAPQALTGEGGGPIAQVIQILTGVPRIED